jgi:peroxiredoxin family protein
MNDIKVWCEQTGNDLLALESKDKKITAKIRKSGVVTSHADIAPVAKKRKSIIVFSSDMDKVLAALIIATGAVTMGSEVTLFFTFWGLNVLRDYKRVKVSKNIIEKMFGRMLPRGAKRLKLSKMDMAGVGRRLMKHVMKSKNISSVEEMLEQARKLGVRIIACNMSMDIMGIRKEELIEGVEVGGVATFLASAEKSDTTLFI